MYSTARSKGWSWGSRFVCTLRTSWARSRVHAASDRLMAFTLIPARPASPGPPAAGAATRLELLVRRPVCPAAPPPPPRDEPLDRVVQLRRGAPRDGGVRGAGAGGGGGGVGASAPRAQESGASSPGSGIYTGVQVV